MIKKFKIATRHRFTNCIMRIIAWLYCVDECKEKSGDDGVIMLIVGNKFHLSFYDEEKYEQWLKLEQMSESAGV